MRMRRRELARLLAGGAAVGALALAPRMARPEPGLVEAELVAALATVEVGGRWLSMWLYGGRLPGPPLVLREGETLRLRFRNRLPEPTNLHFHGLRIPPTGRADNIFLEIPPGEDFTYEWTVPAGEAGTYWYHPHLHGLIATQMWQGLSGGIVIRGPLEEESELALYDDRLVVLRDLGLVDGAPAPHRVRDWHAGKEGPWLLANGRIAPDLRARASVVRLRLVNAANARTFAVARADGRPLVVMALDGRLLAEPVELEELPLAAAQRADLLIVLREEPVELVARRARRGVPSPRPVHRRLVRILPPRDAKPLPLPRRLGDPAAFGAGLPVVAERKITMAMFLLDGRRYRPGRVDVRARAGTAEIWRVVNVGTMHHPFHLHTWPFRPLSRNRRPWPFACVLDTVDLAPGDAVELLVPFALQQGTTVYHCHIAEHGDRGMMATIRVDDGWPWEAPVSSEAICGFRPKR